MLLFSYNLHFVSDARRLHLVSRNSLPPAIGHHSITYAVAIVVRFHRGETCCVGKLVVNCRFVGSQIRRVAARLCPTKKPFEIYRLSALLSGQALD